MKSSRFSPISVKGALIVPFAFTAILALSSLHAQDTVWINPGTATFNDSANWDTGSVPGPSNVFEVSNSGTVLVESSDPTWNVTRFVLGIGDGNTGNLIMNGGTFNNTGTISLGSSFGSTGNMTINGGSLTGTSLSIGRAGDGNLSVTGGSVSLSATTSVRLGARDLGAFGYGTVNHSGGSITGNEFQVGFQSDSSNLTESGFYNLSGTGQVSATRFTLGSNGGIGRMEMSGGTLNASTGVFIGDNIGASGDFTLSGGTITTNELVLGLARGDGVLVMTGGNLTATGFFAVGHGFATNPNNVDGTGLIQQSGGTLTANQVVRIGRNLDNVGVYTISGTAEANFNSGVDVGHVANTSGTLNLDGGTVTTSRVAGHASAKRSVVNFNGGVLRASESTATFMEGLVGDSALSTAGANVLSGGAIIDTNGFNITIGQALIGSSGDGGLTVRGGGTLTLASMGNTYTGNTVVEAGTLVVGNAFFDFSSLIIIEDGGFLDLDFIGTNEVSGLIYNGVSLGEGVYSSGNTSFLLGDGSLTVIPEPQTYALIFGGLLLLFATIRRRL